MNTESWGQVALLVVGAAMFGVWAYKNVWRGPKVTRAFVVEKTWEESATRLPDVLPGMGGVYNASTTNILVLEVAGKRQRYTANDESWKRVRVGDIVKVWIQNETHVVGVYVHARGDWTE
jgi:hypothetical protein